MSVDVIQIEPFRLVEIAAKLACGGDDTLHVEHRRFALSNQLIRSDVRQWRHSDSAWRA